MLGETDPDLVADLRRPRRGARAPARRRLRRARATCSRSAAASLELFTQPVARVPRRVPAVARRAPGRQRGDRARGGRGLRRRAARARGRSRRVRARAVAGPARGRRPSSARAARRRAQRRRRGGAARARSTRSSRVGPRTLVVGLLREKEPREMLDRARARRRRAARVLRGRRTRARWSRRSIAEAAVELGFPAERIEVVDTVAEAVSSALLVDAADGEIVITGSLYVVGRGPAHARRSLTGRLPVARFGRVSTSPVACCRP